MKVYVASKLKHSDMWKLCRSAGLNIVSRWIDIGPVKNDWNKGPIYENIWAKCLRDLEEADCLLVYREDGDILKGALLELGHMIGQKKPIYMVGMKDYTFYHMKPQGKNGSNIQKFSDLESAIKKIREDSEAEPV